MKNTELLSIIGDVDDALILEAKQPPKPRHSIRPVWIAAAILALVTVAVAAAARLWSPGLANRLGAATAAQEALLDSGMTSLIDGRTVTTENGLQLTLEQVLSDGQEITISVRYDAPAGGWFTRENRRWATLYTVPSLVIGNVEFTCSTSGFDPGSVTDNTAYMIWTFSGDCSDLDGKEAVMTLQPVHTPEVAEDIINNPLILTNPVSLAWTLELNSALSRTLAGPFSGTYIGGQNDGTPFTVEDVTVTPISVCFTLTDGLELRDMMFVTGVVLKDGTTVGIVSGGATGDNAGLAGYVPETVTFYYTLDTTIVDLDSISGITFGAWDLLTNPSASTVEFILSLQ